MRYFKILAGAVLAVAAMVASVPASATLLLRGAFPDAALSIDACGSTFQACTVQSDVPNGATVEKAFLYGADINGNGVGDLTLAGNALPVASGTILTPNTNPANTIVHDVTSIMKPIIEGTWGLQSHSVTEPPGFSMDGEILVIVYSDASTAGQTAILLDGELAQAGDTTTLNFANPYAGGDLLMSLGISFGFQPGGQVSIVDVTTDTTILRRLTSCAGGQDDGAGANSALITAGGIGDSPTNPAPTCSGLGGPLIDDEFYNLALGNSADASPFINIGDTFIQFDTSNPTFDDNVFFLAITSSFEISEVDDEPVNGPTPVPEPMTLGMFGVGLLGLGLGLMRRRRKDA